LDLNTVPKGVIYPHVQRAAGSGSPFRELEGSSWQRAAVLPSGS